MNRSYLVGLLCALICIIPHIFLWYKFELFSLSNDPAVWGQYGDFIGGTLNPIFSIINIILLVYLTFTISEIEKKRIMESRELEASRHKESMELEDKRAENSIKAQKIITINQMRYDAVVKFSTELDASLDRINLDVKNKAVKTRNIVYEFFKRNGYLFNDEAVK